MHELLILVRHGNRQWSERWEPLRHGAAGNEQTLRYAAEWVREDSAEDVRVRSLAESLVSSCAPRDASCAVLMFFEFARDGIRYVEDPPGVERIADAWRTIENRTGDCGDKSILLATLLGSIGIKSRFIVQSWDGDLTNGFDHVHLQVLVDGRWVDLDPTPEHAPVGWAAPDQGRAKFEIWDSEVDMNALDQLQISDSRFQIPGQTGMSGFFEDFGSDFFQIGAQFAGSALQQHRLSDAQSQAAGTQFEKAAAQIASLYQSIDARLPNITAADYQQAVAAYQTIESFVSSHPTEYITAQWNSSNYKPAAQNYLAEFQRALQGGAQSSVVGGQLPVVGGQVVNSAGVPIVAGSQAVSIGGFEISGWTIAAIAVAAFAIMMSRR